jgi:hypothetical protein
MPTYTYLDLQDVVKVRLHNQLGQLVGATSSTGNILVGINAGVRNSLEIDFRSTKRKAAMAPNLFNDVYQYACPTDLKADKVIGVQPQKLNRSRFNYYNLVPEENFDQLKQTRFNLLSFTERDMTRKLLASVDNEDNLSTVVSPLDSLTGSGSWVLFGDAETLTADSFDYVVGNGSIKFNLSAAGGTTAGIQATDIPTFDLTQYATAGSVFVWVNITSTTNLTNYKIRLGNDASNYYEMTATTTNEGTAFVTGWNLLRFDFSGKTTTGTVSLTTCDYAVVYMTKTSGKVSENGYGFDQIILRRGEISNLIYYSKYMWQTSAGTWIENATTTTDKINLDTEEFDVVAENCIKWCAAGIREYENDFTIADKEYEKKKKAYRKQYKSEALSQTTDYYFFNN